MVISRERCHICGKVNDFEIAEDATLYRDATCSNCGASLRTSDVADVILKEYGEEYTSLAEAEDMLPFRTVLNASTSGYIHEYLKFYPEYISGEYFDGVKSGQYKEGILCVDLCNIPFGDNSIDLVISEDVFEHVKDYEEGFREVYRVLRPNGRHIFTVPLHENRKTVSRIGNPKQVFHGDPIRGGGCIVYTDFGNDIQKLLEECGFSSTIVTGHKFYEPEEITDADATYDEYLDKKAYAEKYFKYNSIVIIAVKKAVKSLISDWNPCFGQQKEKRFFYLHRYVALKELVKGKDIIDVGYSHDSEQISQTLSDYAKTMCKMNFVQGKLSLQSRSKDVVICFDTAEYLEMEQQRLLFEEIKRVLKQDGILVIAVQNKMENSDRLGLKGECLGGGFYEEEFVEFISREFQNVVMYKHFLEVASFIEKAEITSNSLNLFEQRDLYNPRPKYMLAVAANGKLPELDFSSVCMNESEEYYFMKNHIENRKLQTKQKNNVIRFQEEELERRAVELEHRMDKINELGRLLQEAENVIKLQGEELERRAAELEHRMDKINELGRQVQETENILKVQTEQMEELVRQKAKNGNEKGIFNWLNKKIQN